MDIITFIEKNHLTQEDFARKIGVSHSAVSKWITGTRPTPKLSCKIFEFSKGKISFTDLGWDDTHLVRLNKLLLTRKRQRDYSAKRRQDG